jgi:[ribosomal protein S18]-alanine N-acetyltransferase
MSDWMPYLVEPMRLSDIDQVMEIEQVSFSLPWPARAYRYEITENQHSTMLVVRAAPPPGRGLWPFSRRKRRGRVLGYAGGWLLVDDLHISTIAVDPPWRGCGLGELLLSSLLERGMALGARQSTLEARVTNRAAQELYLKYGFEIVTRKPHYYADNSEDAFIMVTPLFDTLAFRQNLALRQAGLRERLRGLPADPRRCPETMVRAAKGLPG